MTSPAPPRDAATVVVLRDGARGLELYLMWNEDGRAYVSLPGDPRHAMPDVLGGSIFRIQLEAGRYRAVRAI